MKKNTLITKSAARFMAGAGFAVAAILAMSAPAFAADTLYR